MNGDHRAPVPMPPDFRQRVAYWRTRARQERAEKGGSPADPEARQEATR